MSQGSNHLPKQLDLSNCPHCGIDSPNLFAINEVISSISANGGFQHFWRTYQCKRCGFLVLSYKKYTSSSVFDGCFPDVPTLSKAIPDKARAFLIQAINSRHAPAGAVMLAASCVDEMLKQKKLINGTLYDRINQAAKQHIITEDMAKWAHKIRMDANDQRHADMNAGLPTRKEADNLIQFAKMLAEILFVLPAAVKQGIEESESDQQSGIENKTALSKTAKGGTGTNDPRK